MCSLFFTLGVAVPIVFSSAIITSLLFSEHHSLLRTASSLYRTRATPFLVGACTLRLVRIFATHVLWGGLHTGVPLSFLGCPSLCGIVVCGGFVVVYSKQVGSLTLVLCVYFWLAARCLVVACLVFFIVCSLLKVQLSSVQLTILKFSSVQFS